MKVKYVLSIMVIIVVAVVIVSASIMQVRQMSDVNTSLIHQERDNFAHGIENYYTSIMVSNLEKLRMLANVMMDYERLPPEERRDQFDSMLLSVVANDNNIISSYTVWKPNALDGMDARYIGRVGSTETGQYAMAFTRETGQLFYGTTDDLETSMAYLTGPNAKEARIDHPIPRMINKDMYTYIIRMMVPIINPSTNEIVGGVGSLFEIQVLPMNLATQDSSNEIVAMALYAGNGLIMAHYVSDRVGKMLLEADTMYGEQLQAVNQAILNGWQYEGSMHNFAFNTDIEYILTPIFLGNMSTTWTIMVGSRIDYKKAEIKQVTSFIIMLATIALVLAVINIFLIAAKTKKVPVQSNFNKNPVQPGNSVLPVHAKTPAAPQKATVTVKTPPVLPASMKPAFVAILKKIAAERNFSIFEDYTKCKSLLADYTAGEYKKESRLLLLAIEAGCAGEIIRSNDPEISRNKLINKLHDEFAMEKSTAEQIVALLYEVYNGKNKGERR